jgi:FlaA1/EpsC-like NDP-sugar epimerase
MIFGAGRLGMIAHNVLERENQLSYNVVGFIDDNPNLHGKRINGVRVYSAYEAIEYMLAKKKVKEIIIAIAPWEISLERKQQFVNSCIEKELQIKEVADVSAWIKGSLEKVKIQNIKIEDLLGREPISIDINKISAGLNGKHILVTGAAGSIGSEIVRKLLLFNPAKVILVDQAESTLYNFHNELLASFSNINVEIIVGNVSDQNRMRSIFEDYRPEIVFHASAYKHVPLMEKHPYEAVKTNIGGTKVIADLSVEFEVKKFVMISTDKAVNPTNVMGASKRICEIYIQSLSQLKGIKTQFVTTRFGNVLGSNGSVVPLFKSQIEKGGPVTITHKDITRYFMTIPEACQLVLEAGFMGNGSEIYVFDMGSPVKIYDLAEKMIFLSGYIPHKDIKIVVTGLRPGEKLYEELLSSKENCMPTHNEKITIGKVRQYDYYEANSKITEMLDNLGNENDEIIVSRMKDLVEEFISQNSKYEKLDQKVEELEYRRVS